MMILALGLLAQEPAASEAPLRRAIERSLPWLEREGVSWIKQRDCLSCHHVPFLLWSHEEARARGFALDAKKLAEWSDWSSRESVANRTKLKLTDAALEALKAEGVPAETLAKLAPLAKKVALKEAAFVKELAKLLGAAELETRQAALLQHAAREKGDGGGLDTMVQLLLAGSYAGEGAAGFAESTRLKILELQEPDGSWKPGGQLPRMNRSDVEGTELTTTWAAFALSQAKSKEGLDRALAFLKKAKPGETSEWLAVRLLAAGAAGGLEPVESLRKDLVGRQNADGGWSWRKGGASDAFATGQALYALDAADPAVPKARAFLVGAQGADGSWAVPPEPFTKPGATPAQLEKLEPIFRYWGSAWATIGLLRSIPAR